ncbi:MAG: hypothetical protein AAGF12_38855 [Myxococcota bacterium]
MKIALRNDGRVGLNIRWDELKKKGGAKLKEIIDIEGFDEQLVLRTLQGVLDNSLNGVADDFVKDMQSRLRRIGELRMEIAKSLHSTFHGKSTEPGGATAREIQDLARKLEKEVLELETLRLHPTNYIGSYVRDFPQDRLRKFLLDGVGALHRFGTLLPRVGLQGTAFLDVLAKRRGWRHFERNDKHGRNNLTRPDLSPYAYINTQDPDISARVGLDGLIAIYHGSRLIGKQFDVIPRHGSRPAGMRSVLESQHPAQSSPLRSLGGYDAKDYPTILFAGGGRHSEHWAVTYDYQSRLKKDRAAINNLHNVYRDALIETEYFIQGLPANARAYARAQARKWLLQHDEAVGRKMLPNLLKNASNRDPATGTVDIAKLAKLLGPLKKHHLRNILRSLPDEYRKYLPKNDSPDWDRLHKLMSGQAAAN